MEWQNLLLQILVGLLPIGTFQIWFSRPSRTRYISLFIGVVCGLSMLLSLSYPVDCGHLSFDLSFIPYIIGSLYGGTPAAALLSLLSLAVRLPQCADFVDYSSISVFYLLFLFLLIRSLPRFQNSSRNGKLKIAYRFCLFMTLTGVAMAVATYVHYGKFDDDLLLMIVIYTTSLCIGLVLSVHLFELGFERVALQTQLREVSIQYRNEAQRLQQFIDIAPLVVVYVDDLGRISHVNDLASKLAGLEPKEMVGQHFNNVLKQLDSDTVVASVDRVLSGEKQVVEIMRIRSRLFYTTACAIWEVWHQKLQGVIFIAHDMTELQRLKDEVDKMERLSLVGQMAASITHEIRNPMAVIRGFVQLLNERSPETQQSYFRIVLEELDRANAIINDFLSLAQNRIVAKEMSSLHDILKDLLPLIWADANMRGQTIDLQLSADEDPLELNVKEIKQLVLNLARNGMEAMDDKGVLGIETRNLPECVQLRVSDTGIGIPQEKLERLFEPFYTTKSQGTGLGLALCLSIVERHRGKIQVESTVGKGTTFIVTFCKEGYECW